MLQSYATLPDLMNHGFDTVIDVRSPAEFAEDHIPGAINLPVLNNEERAEVGAIYVQESPFLARKLGAAHVFRNAARHIETELRGFGGGWRPLVYCWRGGQRSGSFAWMLGQIGWRVGLIEGGYRTHRRLVNTALYHNPIEHRLVALDGYTGTAKTELLHRLHARGAQVLDLEGLAGHRGSLLGHTGADQPSQKTFETQLTKTLCGFDPSRPVLIEAESSKIGIRIIPPSLWAAMKSADRIEVNAPIEARATYLVRAYDDVLSDGVRLKGLLAHLREYRGNAVVQGWLNKIDANDKPGLTRSLMEQHYDPSYDKSRKVVNAPVLAQLWTDRLENAGLEELADQIEAVLDQVVIKDSEPA